MENLDGAFLRDLGGTLDELFALENPDKKTNRE